MYYGTGRRKRSSARVRLVKGSGKIIINNRDAKEYFPYEISIQDLEQPLVITKTKGDFDVIVNVVGGGFSGQAGAIRLGVSRALLEASKDYRPILKKSGMLTRDSKIKERKKFGLKKARRAPQFSKR